MEDKELTFGMELVGIDFNPSGNPKVTKVKQLAAEIADIVNDNYHNPYNYGDRENGVAPGFENPMKETLFQHAIGEILNAQMIAVKLLTLK